MFVNTNIVSPLMHLHIYAHIQDETDSALFHSVTLSPWNVLKYFINKIDLFIPVFIFITG